MKGEILREDLLAVLKEAGNIVAVESTLPVLQAVLLEFQEEGRYSVEATNLEVGYRREMASAYVESSGSVAVEYGRFVEWLGVVPGDKVRLELVEKVELRGEVGVPPHLKAACGRHKATFKNVFAREEWADLPKGSVVATVDAEDLVSAIGAVVCASDKGAIYFELGQLLRLVATDRSILVLVERPVIQLCGGEVKALVPAEGALKIKPLLSGTVQICLDEGRRAIGFICGNKTLFCQLMSGHYFDYSRTLDACRANPLSWRVETSVLREMVKVGAAFARADGCSWLQLHWQPGDPSSVAMSVQHGRGDLSGTMDGVDGEVGELETCLSVNHLSHVVKAVKSDVVEIRLSQPDKAVYLRSMGEGYEVAVMPMVVKEAF